MDYATSDLSTVIDADPRPSEAGGGQPSTLDGQEAPDPKAPIRSAREDLEHVFKEEAKKAEPKSEPAKEEAAPKAEPAKKDETAEPKEADPKPEPEQQAEKPAEQPERIQHRNGEHGRSRAPDRFMPDAKALWANVPHAVRRDIQTMMSEHEEQASRYSESAREYESIRPFSELAKQTGTTLEAALRNYVGMEQALRQDPVNGFKTLLTNMGIQPQQAVGHILGAFGVDPMALAQHIAQDPQQYVSRAAPQQAQPAPDPRISQLEQQIAEMQQQQLMASVIEPFRAANPRYDELERDIAFFLESGRIPESLSLSDRLAVAYDMAARINPASRQALPASEEPPAPESRADTDFGGPSKSIKSAPGSVSEEVEDSAPEKESIRDSILKAGRRLSR